MRVRIRPVYFRGSQYDVPVVKSSESAMTDVSAECDSSFRNTMRRITVDANGVLPGRSRVQLDWIDTPVGPLLAGASATSVVLLEFSERAILEQQVETVRQRLDVDIVEGSSRLLQTLRQQLSEYFAGERHNFDLPLDYPGTQFQRSVWSTLLTIPYGQTRSYIDVARTIGDVKATRAVGTANGMNRIAIVIPCHRVINANGELGGYGGGLWRKRLLLDLEQGQRKLL
jgi:AraC family transcriptional regulator of adaptative response/methylated-DNA-[protein]-cysteine methyltransferase